MEKQHYQFVQPHQKNTRSAMFKFWRTVHYILGFLALYFSYRIATTPKNDSRTLLAFVCITCIILFACTQTDSLLKRMLLFSRPDIQKQSDTAL